MKSSGVPRTTPKHRPVMPSKRAPNCPAHNLQDALRKTEAIYRAAGRNSFAGNEAVRLMGYNGLNGASRRALGALRSFGLVEGRGANLKVSDDAVLILADAGARDQRERQAALRRTLQRNRVFGDLFDRFDPQDADHDIAAHLQKKYQFSPHAAEKTAQVYCESLELLDEFPSRQSNVASIQASGSRSDGAVSAGAEPSANDPGVAVRQIGLQSSPWPSLPETNKEGMAKSDPRYMLLSDPAPVRPSATVPAIRQDSFTLSSGSATLSWPAGMTTADLEDFTDWLILEQRKIARQLGEEGCARLCREND